MTGVKRADRPSFDEFTNGYIAAMAEFMAAEGEPISFEDIHESALGEIQTDCASFQAENAEVLEAAFRREDYGPFKAGRDFWYARLGEPSEGFWARKVLPWGLRESLNLAAAKYPMPFPFLEEGKVKLSH